MAPGEKIIAQHNERIIRDPQVCGGEPVFKGTPYPCVRFWPAWRKGTRSSKSSQIFQPLHPRI